MAQPFDRYLETELGWIRGLALQLVTDAAAADDLVQETVMAALKRRPSTNEDRGEGARAWLTAVLRKQAKYALRTTRHRRQREERAARAEALPDSTELIARAETQRALSEAVFSLSEPYRSVVLLRYFEGLEPTEIAAQRGVPAATVRSQLSRALAELRATLDRRHDGDRRAWCEALLPLAIHRGLLPKSVGLSMASTLALFVMKHWLAASFVAVLIAGLSLSSLLSEAAQSAPDVAEARPPHAFNSSVELAPEAYTSRYDRRASVSDAIQRAKQRTQGRPYGVVFDKSSSSVLPNFDLEIALENGELETLTTGWDGEFTCASTRDAGPITVRLLDIAGRVAAQRLNGAVLNWNEAQERTVEWNGVDPIVIELEGSVLVPLRFAPPIGLDYDDFRAELFDLEPDDAPVDSALMSCETRVRYDPPRARFRSLGFLASNKAPKLLRITSDDGLWSGAGWTQLGELGYEIVDIELLSRGRITVEVVSSDGGELNLPSLEFRALPDGRILTRDAGEVLAFDRTLSFDGLAPGQYEVAAHARGRRDVRMTLDVVAGLETRQTFVLEPLGQTAAIRGELRSRSGKYVDLLTLTLSAPGEADLRTLMPQWIERDGELVAPFEFADLRPGPHNLQILGLSDDNRTWRPDFGTIEAPAENLVFVCDDVTPLRLLRFDVLDATTNEALPQASVHAKAGERVLMGGFGALGAPTQFHVTDGELVNWRVTLDGYIDASGDTAAATLVDGVLVQTVRLERAP